MTTTKDYFLDLISKFLDNEAILDESGLRFKYSDIEIISKSEFFQSLDRKVVICKLSNDAECLALYFALLLSGAIPLLTSSDISKEEYSKLLIR